MRAVCSPALAPHEPTRATQGANLVPTATISRWILRSNYVSILVTYVCVHTRAWNAQKWV